MSPSGASTPRNFQGSVSAAEDLFKAQTVGLVNLDDFRKRRRDVESNSGPGTPATDGSDAEDRSSLRKKKRKAGRKLLSFDDDDNDDDDDVQQRQAPNGTRPTSQADVTRKVKPNPHANIPAPKAITKATQAAEAAERERLKAQYLKDQEHVRNSEICIPFVFYDGSNIPGGSVKIKKGDHVWLFLERCRKVGAEMGVSGGGNFEGGSSSSSRKNEGRKSWARIGVDDLLLVRGGLIIPHHYDFHYFIANKIPDPSQPGQLLFNYSSTPVIADNPNQQKLLRTPGSEKVEGQDDDAVYTKVVDRRWYQNNKHIYPASLWRAYEPGQDFEELKKGRKDAQGNAFFFS